MNADQCGECALPVDKAEAAGLTVRRMDCRPCYAAAWELCRRGILRPGRVTPQNRTQPDAMGDWFSITEFGKRWLAEQADRTFVPSDPVRLTKILRKFEPRYGHGFRQRDE